MRPRRCSPSTARALFDRGDHRAALVEIERVYDGPRRPGIYALALGSDADECRTTAGCHLDANARRSEVSDFALDADILFAGALR